MSAPAEEIWAILREVAESQREITLLQKESQKEYEQQLKENKDFVREILQSMKETDQKMQETDRKMQETDRQMQKTEKFIQETSEQLRETSKKVKEMTASIGRLGNKLGDFVEEMVRPAAVRLFRERGIIVHEVHRGVSAKRAAGGIEVDLLVVNDTDVVAIECKSTLSVDDVNEHIARLGKLKEMLPAYADKRVFGAVSGMVIPDHVVPYVYKQGLFLIAQSGDHLVISNAADFMPRAW
jgi:hypothetical protein